METPMRYQMIEEIGRGAMGIVFRGKDPKINRDVALKCLRPHILEAHESAGRRFEQEIRALGRLIHPNIVTIFDVWEDTSSNNTYIVMEYVEGTSLAKLIKEETRFTPEQIVHIGIQVCKGLHFAHTKDVIHRDIKPGNILLSEDLQTVKITDFGIARLDSIGLTQSNHLAGTPQYMSPEQCRGEILDGRSDLFAVGALLYELLTQQKAFHGDSVTSIMHQILNHTPYAPYLVTDTTNESLSAVIMGALEKEPDARFSSGLEMADALLLSLEETAEFSSDQSTSESMTEEITDLEKMLETRVVANTFSSEGAGDSPKTAISPKNRGRVLWKRPVIYVLPVAVLAVFAILFVIQRPVKDEPRSAGSVSKIPSPLSQPELTKPSPLLKPARKGQAPKSDIEVKSNTLKEQKLEKTPPLMLTGEVIFATSPTGADIEINGIHKGTSPVSLALPAGSHELVVSKKGYHALEATIDVPSGQKTPLNLKLLEEKP